MTKIERGGVHCGASAVACTRCRLGPKASRNGPIRENEASVAALAQRRTRHRLARADMQRPFCFRWADVAARERTTTSKPMEDASGGVRCREAVGLTVISAYGCRGKAASWVVSSSAAVMGMASCEATRSASCWHDAGIPVMGSRRVLRCAMVHEGEMRRSVEKPAEEICRGTSAAELRDILATRRAGQVEALVPGMVARREMGWCWIE
jgi:hypothetical protein